MKKDLWLGLNERTRKRSLPAITKAAVLLNEQPHLASMPPNWPPLAQSGDKKVWIPGVEIFSREIHPQRHRGSFGELARDSQALWAKSSFGQGNGRPRGCSQQRQRISHSSAQHFRRIRRGKMAAALFVNQPQSYSLRPYDREQWDIMFFLQGRAEIFLRDVRAGLPVRNMRLFVDGDNHRSRNNVGVVIPPGVAHAIRAEGSEDVIMVYGRARRFSPNLKVALPARLKHRSCRNPGENSFLRSGALGASDK